MSRLARQILCQIVERYGEELASDSRRCGALLRDLCGNCKREIFVLEQAARERIPVQLVGSWATIPRDVLLAKLTSQMHGELGLSSNLCRWGVESWALALRLMAEHESTFHFKCPMCRASGHAAMVFAGRIVNCPKCKGRVQISDDAVEVTPAPDQLDSRCASHETRGFAGTTHGSIQSPAPEDVLRQLIRRGWGDQSVSRSELHDLQELEIALGLPPDVSNRVFEEMRAERLGLDFDSPTRLGKGVRDESGIDTVRASSRSMSPIPTAAPGGPIPTAGSGMGRLVILRKTQITGELHGVQVFIDDGLIGTVGNGQTLTLEVTAGRRRIDARGGGLSRSISIDIAPGMTTHCQVHFSSWGILTGGLQLKPIFRPIVTM